MRRLTSLLLTAQLCAATRHGFSIHHDLLAYPQFEVVFSDAFIAESDAKSLLDPGHTAAGTAGDEKEIQANAAGSPDRPDKVAETYEILTMHPHRYLCSIPVIEAPPTQNKTETELAKAEEARELQRASANGWDLINGLDGSCLYYVSGWWSYSFCYGHDVVQFHALPSKGGPPQKDPHSQEYVLGRVQDPSSATGGRRTGRGGRAAQAPAGEGAGAGAGAGAPATDLQIKGDQRYLIQRMDDGTICDLTNRPRTIEIQYHCSPGSTQDRIGWIKEVTTCSYLMLVNTPRLCSDVAFQPPPPSRANVISCRTIVPEAEQAEWHAQKTLEARAAMVGQQHREAQAPVTIGGVVVGGRQILGAGEDGREPPQLKAPRSFRKDGTVVEIIALGNPNEEGDVSVMSAEELAQLDLDPQLVEEIRKQLQEMAGDKGWKLEVVEDPAADNGRELRGVIETDEDEEGDSADRGSEKAGEAGEAGEGSEEQFYRDEL